MTILLTFLPYYIGGDISFEFARGENGLLCSWLNVAPGICLVQL